MYTVVVIAYRLECVHGTKVQNGVVYVLHIRLFISPTDDLTGVPYIRDNSMD
jgi:hypothetical protein